MHLAFPLARLAAALLSVLLCLACQGGEAHRPPPRKTLPARLSAPTSLRKAQLPEEVTKVLADSVHTDLDCSACHPAKQGTADSPPSTEPEFSEARCDHCHEKQAAEYATSVHAKIEQGQSTRGAVCAQCHGDHDIYKLNDPRSRVAKRNVSGMCTACHESPEIAPRLRASAVSAGSHYLDSIHGRALLEKGMTVAPSCSDCHGKAHGLKSPRDDSSRVSQTNQAQTCGQCHEGILEDYRTSIHAAARSAGNLKAPVCTTCHSAHEINKTTNESDFRLSSDKICGKCHATRRNQYLDTYHGRAHDLGDAKVAACYDCHGAHAINKSSDPRSSISANKRLATCQKCHTNANASFATFMPHADHTDVKRYPVLFWSFWAMTSLLLGTFAFFGIHTLFWFVRSIVQYFKDRDHFHHIRQEQRTKTTKLYVRFRPVDRFCHLLIIVSFLTLVATGMPLKFHSAAWAQAAFSFIGGVHAAGKLHRLAAFMTLSYFIIHLSSMVGPIRRRRGEFCDAHGKFQPMRFLRFAFGPDSPVPNLQDLRDFVAHTKWFVGKGPRPTFDRFTYWEKFDYMAVFWGVTVIGLSGLVMWFPVIVSRVIPGWAINVAQIIHSDEALLAAGFIFTFHFFNSHFRPEKFPLDPVIFSGHITEEEMLHERGRQYARLKAEDRLYELITEEGEWSSWKWILTPFGAIALLVGLSLAVGIFWALLHGSH